MNIIFFANGNFGVNALKGLDESEHNILALVTNTDKTKGRGLKKSKNNIYNEANCRKINIIQEDNIHKPSFIQKIKNLNADAFIVISYKIIPIEIFNIPKFGTINLHASYLPKYRGSSPIQKALMNGESKIGLTSFIIDEKIDNGKIIKQKLYNVDVLSTYTDVYNMLSIEGGSFILKTLAMVESGKTNYIKQDKTKISYAKKIKKEDYRILFDDISEKIHNKIRSLTLPGCYCFYGNKRIKLFKTFYSNNSSYKLKIGSFIYENESIVIGCKFGFLTVKELQFEGKKVISAKDFNNMNIKKNIFN